MKNPLIPRSCTTNDERGVTMVLVAIAMVAIIAMAALSIDVITLYLAREEAQRSADTAALAAVRIISVSGITGDPSNATASWQAICGGTTSPASQAATTVALENLVGGALANTVNVTYSAGGASGADCSKLPVWPGGTFGVNPTVSVQVIRTNLPNFFSRVWGRPGNSVSASSTAEAFNPSFSGSVLGSIVPVQPRCVKPWIVPNHDPWSPGNPGGPFCDAGAGACNKIVNRADGTITNPGISLNGKNLGPGIIGERFWLTPDCRYNGGNCRLRTTTLQANYNPGPPPNPHVAPQPNLEYLPGETLSNGVAVPSCGRSSTFETNVAGCDQSTVYQCGVQLANTVDLGTNPDQDTTDGVQCLIHEADPTASQPDGQDTLDAPANYGSPTSYPFLIYPGDNNPLVTAGLSKQSPVSTSPSIVSLPIYDDTLTIAPNGTTAVTIIGFLQVFINRVDSYGNVDVTVLNVIGCSNGSGTYAVGNPVSGNSPVPTRIITPP